MKNFKFPKRFEMEGIDPMQCPVVIVHERDLFVYDNMEEAAKEVDFEADFVGPFADKHNNQRCVRFESKAMNRILSA